MTATLKAPVELSERRWDHDTKELLEFIARILGVSGLLSPLQSRSRSSLEYATSFRSC